MRWQILTTAQLAQPLPADWAASDTVVVMPSTDVEQARRAAALMCSRSGVSDALLLVVLDEARCGFINIANQVFAATSSTWFAYVAQDAFAGRQWLVNGVQTLIQREKGLLAFNDGKWGGALAAFGLGRRSWLAQNYGGQLFYPGYTQHYADTELTVLAIGNAQYCYNPQAVLVEIDWNKDSKPVNTADKTLFAQRKTSCLKTRVKDTICLELFK